MKRWRLGKPHHPRKGQPYHEVNSIRGIEAARKAGLRWIDLDSQVCWRDSTRSIRISVNTHWPRPVAKDGFYDPKRVVDRTTLIHSLTWEQVARLRTREGRYTIRPTIAQYRYAARRRVNVLDEKKAHEDFTDVELHRREHAVVVELRKRYPHFRVIVAVLSTSPLAGEILEAAKGAGRETCLLAHSDYPKSWEQFTDYKRGTGKAVPVR